jgi:hypothetical protein
MITFKQSGNLSRTTKALEKMKRADGMVVLKKYADIGVQALSNATPRGSGVTAESWTYEIQNGKNGATITFMNTHIHNGVNIAIILQYGHGTGTGGWVQGRDYINPAIQPVFDKITNDAWKEITNS